MGSPTIVPGSERWKKPSPPLSAWAKLLSAEHGELAASWVRAHAPSTFWCPVKLRLRPTSTIISLPCFCRKSVDLWARGELQCVKHVSLDTVMEGRSFESSYALHWGVPYTMNQKFMKWSMVTHLSSRVTWCKRKSLSSGVFRGITFIFGAELKRLCIVSALFKLFALLAWPCDPMCW